MKNITFYCTTLLFVLGSLSAYGQKWNTVNGEGPIVTKTLNLDSFEKIGLSGGGDVYLTYGTTQKVVVEGQANIIDLLNKEVRNGKWDIGFKNKKVKNYKELTFRITIPRVSGLSIAGAGDIVTNGAFKNMDDIDFSIAGSGKIAFEGSAKDIKMSIAGSGTIDARELNADNCKVSIAGSGDCYIEVSGNLNVSIAGSGNVRYKGSPKLKTSIAGSGNIQAM